MIDINHTNDDHQQNKSTGQVNERSKYDFKSMFFYLFIYFGSN